MQRFVQKHIQNERFVGRFARKHVWNDMRASSFTCVLAHLPHTGIEVCHYIVHWIKRWFYACCAAQMLHSMVKRRYRYACLVSLIFRSSMSVSRSPPRISSPSIHSVPGIALSGGQVWRLTLMLAKTFWDTNLVWRPCQSCVLLLLTSTSTTVGAKHIVTTLQDSIAPPSPKNNVDRRLAKYTN